MGVEVGRVPGRVVAARTSVLSAPGIPSGSARSARTIRTSATQSRMAITTAGVSNPIHPVFGVEMGYAETRFERIGSASEEVTEEETIGDAA